MGLWFSRHVITAVSFSHRSGIRGRTSPVNGAPGCAVTDSAEKLFTGTVLDAGFRWPVDGEAGSIVAIPAANGLNG